MQGSEDGRYRQRTVLAEAQSFDPSVRDLNKVRIASGPYEEFRFKFGPFPNTRKSIPGQTFLYMTSPNPRTLVLHLD